MNMMLGDGVDVNSTRRASFSKPNSRLAVG
jgi:hypothetical protein